MRNFARRTVAAGVGAIALGCAGIGSAAAADMPAQPSPPEYYGEPEGYAVRPPPAAYVYPPAPVYGYYYAPPAVVVVPPPYYGRPYYESESPTTVPAMVIRSMGFPATRPTSRAATDLTAAIGADGARIHGYGDSALDSLGLNQVHRNTVTRVLELFRLGACRLDDRRPARDLALDQGSKRLLAAL